MKIKITNIFPDNVKKVGKKVALLAITGALAVSLVGCGSIRESNMDYVFEESQTQFVAYESNFCDSNLYDLPQTIESLHLSDSRYITNLSELPTICPNLRSLSLDNCSGIDDISFVYHLPNLEYLALNDCVHVTPELVKYLDESGIKHNITQGDLDAAAKVDEILKEIITEDMTDEQKIQAITFYVIDNCKYRLRTVFESNSDPLESVLATKKGVCASYSYLCNVLLRKAGITSYEIRSNIHIWNLVKLDDKYYYLDPTGVKQFPFAKQVLKHFNIGFYYLQDPGVTTLSAMKDYDDMDKVVIPKELIEDIRRGEDQKTILEKYATSPIIRFVESILLFAVLVELIGLGGKAISKLNSGTVNYSTRSKYTSKSRRIMRRNNRKMIRNLKQKRRHR